MRIQPLAPAPRIIAAVAIALLAGCSLDDSAEPASSSPSTGERAAPPSGEASGAAASSTTPAGTTTPAPATTSGAPWRPFAADSPWNTPIPAAAPREANSDALVADFTHSSPYGVHLDVNIKGFSIPLYWADGATPLAQVLSRIGGDGWAGTNGMNAVGAMPIPSGAAPDPQSDHHMVVVDRVRNIEWGCWDMALVSGKWQAGLCATANLAGSGVRVPATEAQPWQAAHGARACGFPLVAGLIRAEEIKAGRIDHALVVAYPHIRAGWFTPPASTAQARVGSDSISTRGIPCGGRIQFDPSVDLDTLGLSPSGKTIMRALQQYGAYVGDYSGALSLYAEGSVDAQAYWAGGVLDSYELRDKIDFARFRVLEMGRLYDNGNGG